MFRTIFSWLKSIKWDQSRLFDASSAHIGWAGFGTLGFVLLAHISFAWVFAGFLFYALIKEYVIDLLVEKGESVWSSTVDFVTYMIGVLLAGLALVDVWSAFATSIVLLLAMAVVDYYGFFTAIEDVAEDLDDSSNARKYGNSGF